MVNATSLSRGSSRDRYKNVSSPPISEYCGDFRDREVTFFASDRQDSNFESCVRRAVSSSSSGN